MSIPCGYAGTLLNVDLTRGTTTKSPLDEGTLRTCLGGVGLGAKLLYEGVPPGVGWNDPRNLLILASGPLGGTSVKGSGTFCVVTKGAMTGGATSSQANGFFGAFLRFSGADGMVITGRAEKLSYILIDKDSIEIRDARSLAGKDTWETEHALKAELGLKPSQASVICIGPAGENLVKYAAIVGDGGHVAAHNGIGAVMGSKNLKAIVVTRGSRQVRLHNRQEMSALSNKMFEMIKNDPGWSQVYHLGMLWPAVHGIKMGTAPVKNYTTNEPGITEAQLSTFSAQYLRSNYNPRPHACWACQMNHCNIITIAQGPYAGYRGEEPDVEALSACGPAIGNYDGLATTYLANQVDRMGMDVNETSWVLGLVMECYEKGLLTKADTGGLEMTWGNVEAANSLLYKIARREGLGDALAEGAREAARRIGKDAPSFAIYTLKGNSPRSHDHRAAWIEMFDTCVSNTGTIEADIMSRPQLIGLPALSNPFAHQDIATIVGRGKGSFQVVDSLGVCKFCNREVPELLVGMLNAATGWDFNWEEAWRVGRRAVNVLCAFNIRHGLTPGLEAPSVRYGSTPVDGPAKGKSIAPVFEEMRDIYYREMGWDKATGKPLPETLKNLGLASVADDLWG
ncbi:MAG: hypothetical protein HY673_21780 [Chloroflexi bacterium]|nr:hypothetical protein [Chloroflexota bacterium]